MRSLFTCGLVALFLFCVALFSQSSNPATAVSSVGFDVGSAGSSSMTAAEAPSLNTGYARIQAEAGKVLPAGMAIFSYRSGGVLVSEASVPAMPLMSSGRIYAEVGGTTRTGIAIVNPNAAAVTIDFYFIDANGTNFKQESITLDAYRQIAAFLNEAPFNSGASVQGSFTFKASRLVSAVALRGVTNERGEFLMTTLPVADPSRFSIDTLAIPQFADGGGWTTEVALVNPGATTLTGKLDWRNQAGQRVSLSGSYSIAPQSAKRYFSEGRGSAIQVGSIRITSDPVGGLRGGQQPAPSAIGIYTYRSGGVTVTQAGIPASRFDSTHRLFVDNSGDSVRTGVAIASWASIPINVTLELFRLDGTPAGLTGSLSIPPDGQTALFLNEIPGLGSMPPRFQGILRVMATNPETGEPAGSIAVTGLRGRYNERGDFLITTILAVGENSFPTQSSELLFPHFALGAGYETQFVLFSPRPQSSSGRMYFFNQNGTPMAVPLR